MRYDEIGGWSHAEFNFCWKHPVFPRTVQIQEQMTRTDDKIELGFWNSISQSLIIRLLEWSTSSIIQPSLPSATGDFRQAAATFGQLLGDLWPNGMVRKLPNLIAIACMDLESRGSRGAMGYPAGYLSSSSSERAVAAARAIIVAICSNSNKQKWSSATCQQTSLIMVVQKIPSHRPFKRPHIQAPEIPHRLVEAAIASEVLPRGCKS